MKKIQKILLAAMVTVPLLALADDSPCQQFINSDEKAACNNIYSSTGGVAQAKTNFITQHQYAPPPFPPPPPSKMSTPVFNIPPAPSSPGTISTTTTSPITVPIASPTPSNQTIPNIYR